MIIYHQLQVLNEMGLHARPASMIAKILRSFNASVYFTCNSKTVDAKQVMELLLLQAKKYSQIEVQIEGRDAKKALKCLIEIFEEGFKEGV